MNEAASTLTAQVCRFAAQLRIEDIPAEVRKKAKLHVLDTLGCGLAGAGTSLARQLLQYLRLEHAHGSVPVFGAGMQLGPAAAAFGNSACMNALDYDDGYEIAGKGMGHPGATIIAAATSGSFVNRVSGSEFLTAVVAAYEINNRLIRSIQPTIERFREVYGVCQHQTVSACIAFGKLSQLDADEMNNAVGLAATLSNVPSLRKYNFAERPLISLKDFNAPAAEAGVRAVQMHGCGIVGSKSVLDGPTGLWRMLGSDCFEEEALTAGLAHEWAILGSTFKTYPVCRWMHTAMEALEQLIRDNSLGPSDIDHVVIHTSIGLCRDFMDPAPATMVDAQFSFPYAFAALLLGIHPASNWYARETLERTDLLELAGRVRAEVDPAINDLMSGERRRPAGRVTVTSEGKSYASPLIEFALGSVERPASEEVIRSKFMDNATPVIGQNAAEEIWSRVDILEAVSDVTDVLRLAVLPATP
ncbi:MmgE/PrpD family protein [Bradyrhizobium sp. UFLA05-112]